MFLKEQDQIIARMGAEIAYLEQLCQKLSQEGEQLKLANKKLTDEANAEQELQFEEKKKNGKDKTYVIPNS